MNFYEEVYDKDFDVEGRSHGWIQWKGTNVCIDLHCICGEHGHVDAEFFYFYECKCGRKYAVGQNVALIELTPAQVEHVEKERQQEFKQDKSVGNYIHDYLA